MAYLMAHTLMARTPMARDLLRGPPARPPAGAFTGRVLPLVAGCLGIAWSMLGRGALPAQAQRAHVPVRPTGHAQMTSAPAGYGSVGQERTGHERRGLESPSRDIPSQDATSQDTTSQGSSAAVDATPYPGIPEAPADTGRMRHGWHDFSRYDWGGNPLDMCNLAVQGAFATVRRHDEDDTASYAAHAFTPQPAAVGLIAQRCAGGEMTAYLRRMAAGDSAVLAQGLFPAYSIALAMGPAYDTAATALLRAVVARSRIQEQWGLLLGLFRADTATHPFRLNFLERDTALFDSLRLTWARGREVHDEGELGKLARAVVWQHWLYLRDTARARVAMEAALAAQQRFHEPLSLGDAAWRSLLRLKILQYGLRSHAVVDFIKQGVAAASGDSTGTAVLPLDLYDVTQYEQPFVWPQTPYWYSAAGAPLSVAHDSAGQPSGPPPLPPGKVTLIWNPPYGWGNDHTAMGTGGDGNFRVVLWLRQLIQRYGVQGFQVVILEHTRGSAMGEALPPEQEVGAIRRYYQDVLQLPAAVVVEPVGFKTIPDGRRWDEVTDWERRYQPLLKTIKYRNPALTFAITSPEGPFLLDRHGKLRLMHFTDALNQNMFNFRSGYGEPIFELFIQHLLQES